MPYFVISNSGGDTTVEKLNKLELLNRIAPEECEDEYVSCYYGNTGFLEKINDNDTSYWGDNILIIKGEIVTPKPKKVIETFDID